MNSGHDLWCRLACWPSRGFLAAMTLLFWLPISLSLVGSFQYYSMNTRYLQQKIDDEQHALVLRVEHWLKGYVQQLTQDIVQASGQPLSCQQNPITLLWQESEHIHQQSETQRTVRVRSTQSFPHLLRLLQAMANCTTPLLSLDVQKQEKQLVSEWLLASE